MNVGRELPRYQCHKKVWALKIAELTIDFIDDTAKIVPADEGYAPFETRKGWASLYKGNGFDRGEGFDLGYYVVYDDGYTSWSPSKAFEEGYSKL